MISTAYLLKHALEISAKRKLIKKYWSDIDSFVNYGSVLENKVVLKRNMEDLTRGEIVTACFNLPMQVSVLKRQILSEKDPAKILQLKRDYEVKKLELEELKSIG